MATEAFRPCLFRTFSSIVIPVQRGSYRAPVCMGMRDEGALHRTNTEKAYDTWSSLSAFLDGEHGAYSDSSESLLGFSTSLFNDVSSFVTDKEDPPEYIPAPIQNEGDLELSKQLENVLYMLRDVLPGSVCKIGMDDVLLEAWKLVHNDIKVLDPLVCLQGKDKLHAWLQTLAAANAQVNLHDIYAERIIAQPCKNCIYAIWTLLIPGKLQSTSKSSIFEGVENFPSELSLSGESKFEINGTGQVVSVESKWYVPNRGEEMLEFIKKYLISLLHKEMLSQ